MRTPLQVQQLTDNLRPPWTALTLVPESPSTNADLVSAVARGQARPGSVLVAEHQSAGRGRLGRTWSSIPGASLTFSALVPTPARPGWVPLLTGLALAEAIHTLYAVRTGLKWPNDLLGTVTAAAPADRKVAGILCELTAKGIVIGIGLNVDQREDELPVPTAGSLRLLAGGHPAGLSREGLLLQVLTRLGERLAAWERDPDEVREAYRRSCLTLGREVLIDLGARGRARGRALDVDDDGRLVVDFGEGAEALSAGDVTHVR